jgi:hypothetical protein
MPAPARKNATPRKTCAHAERAEETVIIGESRTGCERTTYAKVIGNTARALDVHGTLANRARRVPSRPIPVDRRSHRHPSETHPPARSTLRNHRSA